MTMTGQGWRLECPSEFDGGAAFFEGILDDMPQMGLIEAVDCIGDVEYYHGTSKRTMRFNKAFASPEIDEALSWAENPTTPELQQIFAKMDSNRQKAVQKFAAIRLWTTEAVCYVVTSLMRDRNRSATSLAPILPYLRLLLSGLHRLPDTYLFEGTLFRAESNVRSNWDSTMQPGKTFGFFTLTSFSTDPEAIANFRWQKHFGLANGF